MADGDNALMQSARERAAATPLDQFHVADVSHFTTDTWAPWFERLRREDPVHYCANSEYGPYWSVTRFNDIVAVDSNHEAFSSSSERGGIAIQDGYQPHELSSFIGLEPPDHDAQRRVVMPRFSTQGLAGLEPLTRRRAAAPPAGGRPRRGRQTLPCCAQAPRSERLRREHPIHRASRPGGRREPWRSAPFDGTSWTLVRLRTKCEPPRQRIGLTPGQRGVRPSYWTSLSSI
jgi:hypothetical protein